MRKLIIALSSAAALLAFGATAAQAAVAAPHGNPDATPACSSQCFDLSSLLLGRDYIQNAYIYGNNGTGGQVGIKINLKRANDAAPNQDFSGAEVGTLGDFCGNLIRAKSYVCLHYKSYYPVFESDWAPYGNQSGLCVGLAIPNVNNEDTSLQNCGVSSQTMWVGDIADGIWHHHHLYMPWVNGSDPDFSHPLVLTVNDSSFRPENELVVQRLNLLTGGAVPDAQMFTIKPGPVA